MKPFVAQILVFAGLLLPASAQAIDNVPVSQCDLLAANPRDPDRKTSGVAFEDVDTVNALNSCVEAHTAHPDVARFTYMLGRVQDVMGNLDQAISLYEDAASLDYRYAAFILGVSYYEMAEAGKDIKRSLGLAVGWFEKAASLDVEYANYYLALILSQSDQNHQNYAEAVQLIQPLVQKSDAYGQNLFGILHQAGKGVEQSDIEAAHWYELSAKSGLDYGQHNFGLMLFNGTGVERDYDEAFAWLNKAAIQGHEDSIVFLNKKFGDVLKLAVFVEPGSEFPEDFYEETYGRTMKDAVAWFSEQVEIGDPHAHYILGVVYWQGLVFEADKDLGMQYLLSAAELGSEEARFEISRVSKATDQE